MEQLFKIYRDAYYRAIKHLEQAELRERALLNQLNDNRENYLNLLRLLESKFGLTAEQIVDELARQNS